MAEKPDPKYTPLTGNHVELCSQIRFKMAPESANLAKQYRAEGKAQVLGDSGDRGHVICFPSADESLFVIEIVHRGDVADSTLYEAHKRDVAAFQWVQTISHPPVEIVDQNSLEPTPHRDRWVRFRG